MKNLSEMTYDEQIEYANQVDPNQENYDLWTAILFGDNIEGFLNAINDNMQPPTGKYDAQAQAEADAQDAEREWFLNHPTA